MISNFPKGNEAVVKNVRISSSKDTMQEIKIPCMGIYKSFGFLMG